MRKIPEDQPSEPSGPDLEQSKLEFSPDPKTSRQQRNNDKVLMRHWKDRGRQYSPGARNRYRLLRRDLRKTIAEAGASEQDLLAVLIGRKRCQPGVKRLEELPPQVLRKVLGNWDTYKTALELRMEKTQKGIDFSL
jgi:hypothetical protein